ncbi:MAG: hypothetical protein M3136_04385 [Thermoproteota archaeon]|nr:hypothetical protein [Thermoproteota archaeon]
MVKTTLSLRKISFTTIVVVVFTVATMTMSSTVFSTSATAPMAFGERIMIDSKQLVTVSTTNGIDQNNNNNTIDRNTSSLGITQSPENGLDVECEGDLICEIFGNNTLVDTNTVENTTTTTVITSTLDALNQTLNQSLTQLLNQSSIPLQPFGDNDFNDMLNNDSGSFNEQDDLDSEMDEWVDRMLNATLGDLQAPLQTSPDLLAVSV